ncbi:MAG TPA: ROK family transcriptional regulator [Bauldia sp.]|nr:ROK family transcriptional regulator [Bauldia sp.]
MSRVRKSAEGRSSPSLAGTNLGAASSHNRRIIIDALRRNGAMSRAELARSTLLTRQTMSNIMDELEAAGLVEAEAAINLGRGQPAIPYRLVPNGAFAIGLHIDRRYLRAVAVDLLCRPIIRIGRELPDEGPYQGVPIALDLIAQIRRELRHKHRGADARTAGLGVAMPGPFGVEEPGRHQGPAGQWHAYPVHRMLTEATGLSVRIFNDAAAATLAEKLAGIGHGIDNFVYVFLAHGVGAGIVINGELVEGARGNVGEVGEMIMSVAKADAGPTLEREISLTALAGFLGASNPSSPETYELIEQALRRNDPRIAEWIGRVAPRVRQAVQIIESIFDPETIIFGGEVPRDLLERLISALEPLFPSVADRSDRTLPRLLTGDTDRWAVALGAASEPISREFDPRLAAMLKGSTEAIAARS